MRVGKPLFPFIDVKKTRDLRSVESETTRDRDEAGRVSGTPRSGLTAGLTLADEPSVQTAFNSFPPEGLKTAK